ncbi:hypothetical protein NKH28_25840 [Mesorhizobium sp. M1227]
MRRVVRLMSRTPKMRLQLGDVLADSGRRETEPPSGFGKAVQFRHLAENLQRRQAIHRTILFQ